MDVFAALADPVRRSLLRSLVQGPARVSDLAAHHPISRPAVSRHLRLLGEAGLVTVAERGRERHCALRPEALTPVAKLLEELTASSANRLTDSALDALDTEVRRTTRQRRTAQPAREREEIA